ncbi:MAG: hypothetical protein HOM97_08555 [Nitrospina sp.]|nr:hypothetical protein [Nitrospina sp.]
MKMTVGLARMICVIGLILFLVPSPSQAFYKKKVKIGEIQNPSGWKEKYNPSTVLKTLIIQELKINNRVQLLSLPQNNEFLENSRMPKSKYNAEPAIFNFQNSLYPEIQEIQEIQNIPNNEMIAKSFPSFWPANMGQEPSKASMTEIRGQIIKFIPDSLGITSDQTNTLNNDRRENAQFQILIQLIQHKTGRVLFEQTFKALSSAGTQSFSAQNFMSLSDASGNKQSSMYYALKFIKGEIISFINHKLDSIKLEGEIISLKNHEMPIDMNENTENEILINIGYNNGVRVGDLFNVYAMGINMHDPYTGSDVGDIYVKAGVIQISNTGAGHAIAQSIAGNDYKPGFLIQSVSQYGGEKDSMTNEMNFKLEKKPWWEFISKRTPE